MLPSELQSFSFWCFSDDTFHAGFYSEEERGNENYERCGYFGIESPGSPGSKSKQAHGTAQLGLYFALLKDVECPLSEVRNMVFIYKNPSPVFSPPVLPTTHTHAQKCHQIAKTFFWGPAPHPDPRMLRGTGCTSFLQLLQPKGSLRQLQCAVRRDAGWDAHTSSQEMLPACLSPGHPFTAWCPEPEHAAARTHPWASDRERGGSSRWRFSAAARNAPLPMKYLWWHVA